MRRLVSLYTCIVFSLLRICMFLTFYGAFHSQITVTKYATVMHVARRLTGKSTRLIARPGAMQISNLAKQVVFIGVLIIYIEKV